MADTPYQQLEAARRTIKSLIDVSGMLSWDRDTMMPPGAAEGRTAQQEAVAVATHAASTAPKLGEILAAATAQPELDDWQRRNVELSQRDYDLMTALPDDLIARKTRAVGRSHASWLAARDANDWTVWLSDFEEIVAVTREIGGLRGAKAGITPYDACLDEYEQGNRMADIQPLFAELESFLRDVIPAIQDRQVGLPTGFKNKIFPIAQQEALCRQVMRALGYDENHGRLDTTVHPFCGEVTGDVRICTRYDEMDFTPALFGLIHETGHALYEQKKPAAQSGTWFMQPVGFNLGMMIHESQSLLMEMQVGCSTGFLGWVAPLAAHVFGLSGDIITPACLAAQLQHVQPSLIRTAADEVTYPLHIILRTKLESQLINGGLEARHVRDAWNTGMEETLGVTVPDDKHGCLQDVHWPEGLIGYFPCYTQGAIAAAAFFAKAKQDVPGIEDGIAAGNFKPLTDWLYTNIHLQGSRYTAPELIRRVTGAPLSLEPFKQHIRARYLPG